jgi:hypothetical protein
LSVFAHAQCTGTPANAIVAENCLTGNPSQEWDIANSDAGSLAIQGFATDISVTPGNTINFKINTPSTNYSINIYRIGYYQGNGARKIASVTPSVPLPQSQPACISNTTTGLTDCGNWAVSASWTVPTTALSGVYVAHLVRNDTSGDSHIIFIVRNDSSHSAIMYQTSDPTWEAYNYYGNGSLYGPGQPVFGLSARAYQVSYNRPALTRGYNGESATWFFGAEFAMVQWLEQNGYDVSYTTGLDADRNGALIKNHKVYMDSGHDEYVSPGARSNIQAARDAGVNLAFFSGNEFFWKTRWANSVDGSNTPYRTLICYKETLAFAKIDPQDPPTWTGTWRDPTFSPPADGGLPENQLTGTLFTVNGVGDDNDGSLQITVPQADGQMRFWRNTAAATLAPGATYTAVVGSLGYEWDEDVDNGFRPAGAFRLSTTTHALTTDHLLDYGATYGAGTATHHMMMYRATSGALVFGAGTVDWAYGLNSNHDQSFQFTPPAADVNMQQATLNLLADMGVQPGSIQPGLVKATASTDTVAPHSLILTPNTGASVSTGSNVTITGTASDTGGVVAGIEFSGDNGVTWHPATGRANWTYSWTPTVAGTTTLLSRAVDDSGNIETPTDGVPVTVSPQTCPCTIFGTSAPTTADSGDGTAVEVGVKFRADSNGSIVGVRFYKSAANTGSHVGHIWSDSGQLLGTATFTAETASGWQQANFSSPIAATANTSYVVSYYTPSGHYSDDSFFFETSGTNNPPLHALQNGVDGTDGLFIYGAGPAGGFPSQSDNASNYWVDVIYTSSNTYAISGTISGNGGGGSTVTLTGPESLSTTADSFGNFTFNGVVNGNYSVSASNPGVTISPSSQPVTVSFASFTGVAFTATVTNPLNISGTITGGAGATVTLAGPVNVTTTADSSGNYSFNGLLSASYTVTPSLATFIFTPSTQNVTLSGASVTGVNFTGQVCDCVSIFPASSVPATIDSGDTNSTEIGVLFRADASAYLTGIRFYKASTNTGTHVGHLWSQSGQLLGTATFPGETASGWQQGYFSSPVLINAGTPYIASYLAPSGHYSATSNYFASAGVDNPPLHALANGVSGPNGVYIYTASPGAFPTNTFQATNYWIDVLYAAQPFTVSGTISGPGAAGATVTLSGGSQVTTTSDASGYYSFPNVFAGSYTVTPSNPSYIFIPGSQNITVAQSNITGVNFTVPALCPCDTLWTSTALPTKSDSGDTASLEVGTKMRMDQDGYVLGVRFYKAATNTGTHIGNLWSETATTSPLGSATFTNESASGWQQVVFGSPVPVKANTTYVASYFTPTGHYAADGAFFATTGVDNPPVHALENGVDGSNGVFTYGASSSYPNGSFNATNYWVDLIYAPASTYTISGTISGPGGPGAAVALTGTKSTATTADVNGNYSFTGLANGNYVVTPSLAGFSYTAPSQSVTISGGHNLGVNFASAAVTYSISGNVAGAPGITVSLSGSTTASTTADSSGNFTFASVPNGNYTVTPAGPGYTVTPTSQNVTVNGAVVSNVNFRVNVLTYSVSGTIIGGAGATVSLIGPATYTTTANSSGQYSFSAVPVGNYTILPSMTGDVFSPANIAAAVTNASITGANFAVPTNCPCDTIWTATSVPTTSDAGDANAVELGVKFTASADGYIAGIRFYKAGINTGIHQGNLWSAAGQLLGSATFQNESSSGWQQVIFPAPVPVQANVTYVASYYAPSGHYSADLGYFANAPVNSPPLQALQNSLTNANGVYLYSTVSAFPKNDPGGNAVNYWVDPIYTPTSTYTIAGNISDSGGPGATISLSGAATATTTANSLGNFAFNGVANGSYTVTPSRAGVTYSPVNLKATVNNNHVLALSFSSIGGGFEISGNITGVGGPGATVTLTGASTLSTVADGSGLFAFTGLVDGSYTVSVSNGSFAFTPASQSVTINNANTTITFATGAQTFSISGTISGVGGNGATVTLSGASSATTTSNSGTFTFTGLANGNYTVSVANTGFTFTPTSQPVTINGANATTTFASTASTFSITGTISGAGGTGATVTLSGAASATSTTSDGTFSFTALANGAYTVTVANPGFTFTPAGQAVTINNANATATFASAAQTFTISGTISGAGANGATITLSGTASGTTTSAAGGFSFTGLAKGSYTVAVAQSGFVYTPTSQAITITTANATTTFSSVAQTYTISGTISGTGGNGATVNLSGSASATTVASSTGAYSFTVINGTYTVTPSKSGFVFTPASPSVTVNNANVTVSFTSAARTFTISGTISGTGGNGATVKLTGTSTATTTASSTGAYSFTGVTNGSYVVTPTKSGFTYTPATASLTISGANGTANFSSVVQTFTVSGTITGTGGNGATVKLTGSTTATVTANATGAYSFSGIPNGTYTITPTKTAFTFNPTSRSVTVNGTNVTVTSFTSTAQTFSISGTITGAGAALATVKLSGAASASTTTSIFGGTYSFTGLLPGTYTVTPSKSGRTYTPTSQSTTIVSSNVTGLNFTSR